VLQAVPQTLNPNPKNTNPKPADGVQQQDDVVPPQWRLQRVSLSHNVMTGPLSL
jgi:hypothetical protein